MAEEPQTQASSSAELQQQHSPGASSSEETLRKQPQAQFSVLPLLNGDFQMLPVMFPTYFPGFYSQQQYQEQINNGRGLYAVSAFPFMGPTAGLPPNTLIPFTYNLPSGPSSSETGAGGEDQGQQPQPLQQQQPQQMQHAQQRQVVVRRFQIAFQLDLLLILKLVAVIFLFNQDGSRQRLVLLVFFASLVYLYQTGALAPLIRWLSQGMQRAAAPPQPARPAAREDNAHAGERAGNENAAVAEGQPGGENENQPLNGAVENEQGVEPRGAEGGQRWWGIVREIQMIVFGFITSLLPGFHNID
ncbi:hypothetical protein ACH5RR_006795 [Cinchona calisaya]|uniref:Transmembrane protein n=1 Tax=Cinchona calisaya TaxID=153742 RepID=A0ABD3AQ36_9GENT